MEGCCGGALIGSSWIEVVKIQSNDVFGALGRGEMGRL